MRRMKTSAKRKAIITTKCEGFLSWFENLESLCLEVSDFKLREFFGFLGGKKEEQLGSLAAGEVHESVKFSSREKLAAGVVFEGRVELLPSRGQRAASLERGRQLGIEYDQARS
jgi:hypothetical protein